MSFDKLPFCTASLFRILLRNSLVIPRYEANHILGNPLFYIRILFTKLNISVRRFQAKVVENPFLRRYKGFLYDNSKESFKFGNFQIQFLQVLVMDLNQF